MPAIFYGQEPVNVIEQSSEYEVTAEGVLTVTRRWEGTLLACAQGRHDVRSPMPIFSVEPSGLYNPFNNVQCKCVSSRIWRRESEIYVLEEQYQGTIALPFSIFSWQTQALERPIPMHPRFDTVYQGSPFMRQNLHWCQSLAAPGTWNGFPPYLLNSGKTDGNGYPCTTKDSNGTPVIAFQGTPPLYADAIANPFRGIESYKVPSGIWKRTSYTLNPVVTGNLWYLDPPQFDQTVPVSLTQSLPDVTNTLFSWIKSQEDVQNLYRGASEIWQVDESWFWNSLGWIKGIYSKT